MQKVSGAMTYILSLTAIMLWGMSYIWNDRLLDLGIPPDYFVFLRSAAGGMLLLLLNLITGTSIRINGRDLPKLLLVALFEPFANFLCETNGIAMTGSPSYSAMITASAPLFSLAAGVLFFSEKLSTTNLLGFALTIGGILLTTLTFSSGSIGPHFVLGIALLTIGALSDVGMMVCTKWISGHYKPQVIAMYQFLFGALFFSPLFFTRGLRNFNPELYLSPAVLKPILCLTVLCTCICFSIWAFSVKKLGVAKAAILLSIIPIVTAIAGVLLGSEVLHLWQWAGIVIATMGIILSQKAA